MCGRFASATPIGVLAETFAVSEVKAPDLGEKYNVAPTDEVYAVAAPASSVPFTGGSSRSGRRIAKAAPR
jgi:putative SOS response-associated peptidase YedK